MCRRIYTADAYYESKHMQNMSAEPDIYKVIFNNHNFYFVYFVLKQHMFYVLLSLNWGKRGLKSYGLNRMTCQVWQIIVLADHFCYRVICDSPYA